MRLLYLIICLASLLQAAKIDKSKITQKDFDQMINECKQMSFSSQCYFVGMQAVYPKINEQLYEGVEMSFESELSTQEGLEMLQKACQYDKAQKINAIKTKKNIDEIRADEMACYTLFAMYESFSDSSEYHKAYIKAMRPYIAEYDAIDIYESVHDTNIVAKNLKTALSYYKHMCYEPELQTQCAKYKGLVNKLQKLCKKGQKNACVY